MQQLIHSFDLDSTLIDTRPAHHLIDQQDRANTDWEAYGIACADPDFPVGPAAPIIKALIDLQEKLGAARVGSRSLLPVDFIVVSRRNNAARERTEQQLAAHGWSPAELMLLGDEHSDPSVRTQGEWKAKAIRDYEARTGNRVVIHYDDFDPVTQVLTERGIPAVTLTAFGTSEGHQGVPSASTVGGI